MTNTKLLRSKMILYGDTQKALAKHLHISPMTMNAKINNRSCFLQSEIAMIQKRYSLTNEEVTDIFLRQ